MHASQPSVSSTPTAAPLSHALPISHVSSPWPSVLLPSRPCTLGAPGIPGSSVLRPMLWKAESGYWLAGGVSVAEMQGNTPEIHLCHHPHMSLHCTALLHATNCIFAGHATNTAVGAASTQAGCWRGVNLKFWTKRLAKGSELSCVDSYCLQCRWNRNPVPGTPPVNLLPETPSEERTERVQYSPQGSGRFWKGPDGLGRVPSPHHVQDRTTGFESLVYVHGVRSRGQHLDRSVWAIGCCWRRQNSRRYSH